jgi:hypothetical protein
MSIDSFFDEDVEKATKILESTFESVKEYSAKTCSKPYEDAEEFIKFYNLCVNRGRATDNFRAMLPRYLSKFGNSSFSMFNLLFLGTTGGLAVYTHSEVPIISVASSLAFGLGLFSAAYDFCASKDNSRLRNALAHDSFMLDEALKKIRDERIVRGRMRSVTNYEADNG